jgi:ATP-dependent 26S proteasome regulatory subunit
MALQKKQEALEEGQIKNSLLEEAQKRLQTEINELVQNINNQKTHLFQQTDSIQQLERDKNNLEHKLLSKEEEIKSLQTLSQNEKDALQITINEQKNILAENQNRLNQIKQELATAQEEIEQLKNINQEYQQQLQQQKKDIDQLQNKITEKLNIINANAKEIQNKNMALQKKQEALEEGQIKNSLLEEAQKRLQTEINELVQNIQTQKKYLSQKIDFIAQLQRDKNNLANKLLSKEKEIQSLQTLSQNEKDALQIIINEQKNILAENQSRLNQNEEKLKIAQSKIKEQEQMLMFQNQLFTNIKNFHSYSIEAFRKIIEQSQEQKEKSDYVNHQRFTQLFNLIQKESENKEQERKKIIQTETTTARFLKDTTSLQSFKDVIGMDKEKEQLQESLSYLKHPEEYQKMGVKKQPKGILLYGPPGTGKTFLAEAFAKESGLPFYAVTSSDFSRSYVGEGPRIIENLFKAAREKTPSIIFIDECESIFRKRNSDGLTSDHGNMISAFLSQIEGIHTVHNKPVFIIAATNFKDEIDSAILSRFNKLIKVDYWKEEELKTFVKKISKNYKLDVRTYKYLDNIIERICKSNNDFLKSPRKIIEILDQAAGIAIETHHHLNILPIDLQLSFDRVSQNEYLVDWKKHVHDKPDITFLSTMKEYKNIPIKHLFKDSSFSVSERKYFDLINNHYKKFQKIGYNKNMRNEIESIEFSDDKEKIKQTYNDENPLPDGLLGIYFEDKENIDPDKMRSELKKIDSLEEILKTGMKKVDNIYLVWDVEKLNINKKTANLLMDKFFIKYPFLRGDSIFKTQVLQNAGEINNNKPEIEQFILTYLEEKIKKPLINNIFSEIETYNLLIEENDQLQIKNIIENKLNNLFISPNFFSLEEIKLQLLLETKNYLELNKKQILEKKINLLIAKINLNNMIFSSSQITKFLKNLKTKVYDELVSIMEKKNHISSEEVKKNIQENISLFIEKLFSKKWDKIYSKLRINIVNYEKHSLINMLQTKIKKNLFFENISLDAIIDILQQDINEYENDFEEKLKEKVLRTVQEYILIDNILEEQPNIETIELISKGAFLVAKKESQQPDTTEKKIQQEIYEFIKNYNFKNTNTTQWFIWIKKHFYIILFILMILYILIKSGNKNKNNQ